MTEKEFHEEPLTANTAKQYLDRLLAPLGAKERKALLHLLLDATK